MLIGSQALSTQSLFNTHGEVDVKDAAGADDPSLS